MTYEKEIDVDLFNQEQRPFNYDFDCLEFWAYLRETWKVDTSDEDYERYCDEHFEERYAEQEAEYERELELDY